jgi:F-type H+-transporting ATPase subunit a
MESNESKPTPEMANGETPNTEPANAAATPEAQAAPELQAGAEVPSGQTTPTSPEVETQGAPDQADAVTTPSAAATPAPVESIPGVETLPEGEPAELEAAPVAAAAVTVETQPNYVQRKWTQSQDWAKSNPRRAITWAVCIILFIIGLFIPVAEPHVALSGEPIFSDGPWWLTNTTITTIIVDIIVILLAVLATMGMKLIPGGLQNFMEMVIEYLFGLSESVAGNRAARYFPWVATVFFFVIVSNWIGLIPGVGSIGYYHEEAHAQKPYQPEQEVTVVQARQMDRQLAMADGNLMVVLPAPALQEEEGETEEQAEEATAEEEHATFVPLFRAPSSDLNVTFALAITIMVMVQVWGIRALGGSYFHKYFNASGHGFMRPINAFVGILELISEFARVIAFGFRLFGNIFAGEVVLATMAFLVTFFLPVPFYLLEILVGFVQALVFMMLALVFFSMATMSHGHDDHAGEHAATEAAAGH